MGHRILVGDVRARLKQLEPDSIHCVVTSPPYFRLRDYGVEGQMGLERTPEEYVAAMAGVFEEVRRVLRHDGTLWLNIGDSYAGSGKGRNADGTHSVGGKQGTNVGSIEGALRGNREAFKSNRTGPTKGDRPASGGHNQPDNLKPKDLIGVPWMLAFALRSAGWWLRQEIIWAKPNPMPESVTDRCTKAHEQIFLLSKSQRYYFDQEAILEPCSENTHARLSQDVQAQIGSERAHAGCKTNGNMKAVARRGGGNRSHKGTEAYEAGAEEHRTKGGLVDFSERQRKLAAAGSGIKNNDSMDAALAIMPTQRNKRSVWTVASESFYEAHFATFPPALIEPCILAGCPKGGTVLDPFFGAGTTGLVCDRLNRNCIGIEINPKDAAMAKRRIESENPLFARVGVEE